MLRLLQITEFSPRSLHSLAKEFCRDFRKNILTCCALKIFLLSADFAIYIRGYPEPHESDGVDIAAFVMRYALGGFQPQGMIL